MNRKLVLEMTPTKALGQHWQASKGRLFQVPQALEYQQQSH